MKELFLEIGTEEIPAGFIPKALEEMKALLVRELSSLSVKPEDVKTFGTPRRLVLSIEGLAEKGEDASVQVMGPAKKAAFDANGNLTKAAEGFARSQGVEAASLKVIETAKGEYLAVQREVKGRKTSDLLKEVLPRLILSIPFRKSMRWGSLDVRFARPVHWIVALYGGEVIPFAFGDIASGNETRGHRFMAPAGFKVSGLADYLEKTEKAFIIVDHERRRREIWKQVVDLADSVKGAADKDEELLETVTFLNEYPMGLLGGFDGEFLKLPEEVLIASMKKHQKYFCIRDGAGKLLPHFVTMSNTKARDMDVVRRGNERVLRARLSDARFFYEEDRKVPLKDRVERLKGIVFQVKLGTSHEKMERFRAITEYLTDHLGVSVKENASRAAYLCKADLVTGMVGEFPDLQGIMGREYALLNGEDREVATAIYEHYLPRFAEDRLPETDAGAILSLADRIDTICGCFGIGEIPTGTKDQFAQRRHTIAIINIVLARNYRISLSSLIDRSLGLLKGKITRPAADVRKDVLEYIKGRLQNLLVGDGLPADVVDAVLSADFDDILRSTRIVRALADLKKRPDFEPLAVAFKRAVNITKGTVKTAVMPSHFQHATEEELYEASGRVRTKVTELAGSEQFDKALLEVAALKGPVDAFFDGVLVMDKDENIRNNRLALLWGVSDIFSGFADFSKIATNQ